jgi:hypothetical protein
VELTGEDFEGLAVEGEVVAFDGEGVGGLLCPGSGRRRRGGEGEGAGEEEPFHGLGAVGGGECSAELR